jgi:phosphoesterase RecJ-like protein
MFEKILEEIRAHERIIIHRHNKPDGDALGSQIGLKYILEENFPEKEIYIVGDAPGYLSFMNGADMDEIPDSYYQGSLAILLDSGSHHLISDNRYTLASRTCRIDHHIYSETFTDVEVIDSTFESCCGMITEFARESGLQLTQDAARALFTGMVTDSGRFRYDCTNARTFRLASFLVEQGFDRNEIFRDLYSDDFASKKLKAAFVLKIQFTEKNIAYIYTTKEEFDALNTDIFTVSRGMVSTMADIKGVPIWVNFTETENGVLCEIRSGGDFNINPIAVKYGGGGHAKASGATVPDRESAMSMLRDLDNLL